jgi:hypothetical protein
LPITSAAELSIWWAEVLSDPGVPDRALSLLWLDSSGHRFGRGLSMTGVPPRPDSTVIGIVLQLRDTVVEDSDDPAHLALALSRPGRSSITTTDQEWAAALEAALDTRGEATWSLHVATGRWITTVIDPPAGRFDPRRIARRSPAWLLDRGWLLDQD